MKVKYKESYYKEQEIELEEAIEKEINNRTRPSYESDGYVYELSSRINVLENIIINMLKDIPLDKINKYLSTNFKEVK